MGNRPDSSADVLEAMLDARHPIKAAAASWATAHLPATGDKPADWVVDRETWKLAGDYGLLGIFVPPSHGGTEARAVDFALMFEGIGTAAVDNAVIYGIASQALTANRSVAMSGSPAQLDRWARPLAAGELFACFAMSEADAGSHPWNLSTRAVEQPDGSWVLNGTKTWATLGPICDVAIVFAATDPAKAQWGISAFLIDAETPGFERLPAVEKMGMKACPLGDLRFTDCHVGADALLGKVGAGASIFSKAIEAERAFLYASAIGAMERSIDRAVEYARVRRQAGVHIGSHQAVSHRIADLKLQHEAARLLLYKTAARFDRGDAIALDAALTKLIASEGGVQAAIDAMRTFGASGYTTELGFDAEIRDALGGLAYSGTPDITRNIITFQLGLNRPL